MNIKLPLAYRSHRKIVDADGNFVVEVFSGGQGIEAADALQELVVAACNSHQQLVDACKLALKTILDEAEARNYEPPANVYLVAELEAALAAAGENV